MKQEAETIQLPMLAELPFDVTLPEGAMDETIRVSPAFLQTHGGGALTHSGTLPLIPLEDDEGGEAADLAIRGELGAGGMGVVKLAHQRSLDREVAVKMLRGASPEAASALLREATLAGGLEHPNIIPIHALGLTSHGVPALVMKRVEGVSWRALIVDEAHPRRDLIKGDALVWHLGVLMQVCQAVHFAHSRGVIHRDLKPDNVMIGAYGEVYLLDWGIALRQEQAHHDGTPRIVGTPCYMAPEMTRGDERAITQRTDIYLLGAILHEILTGQPPHAGDHGYVVLMSAHRSEPMAAMDAVPEELRQIRNRAMHLDPDARYESAEAMADALRTFLLHRDSLRLTTQGAARLEALREAMASGDQVRLGEAPKLFGACRFGLQQALEAWPGNARAEALLHEALVFMASAELEAGNARAAEVLLVELHAPEPELSAKLKALKAHHAAEHAELERLREATRFTHSPAAAHQRLAMVAVAAFFLTVVPLAMAVLQTLGMSIGYTEVILASLLGITSLAGATFLFRRSLEGMWINRRMIYAGVALFGFCAVLRLLGWATDAPLPLEMLFEMTLIAYTVATLAIHVDRRLWGPVLLYGPVLATALVAPQWVLYAFSLANLVSLVVMAHSWRQGQRPHDSPPQPAAHA